MAGATMETAHPGGMALALPVVTDPAADRPSVVRAVMVRADVRPSVALVPEARAQAPAPVVPAHPLVKVPVFVGIPTRPPETAVPGPMTAVIFSPSR